MTSDFYFGRIFLTADERLIWTTNDAGDSKGKRFTLLVDIKLTFDGLHENKYDAARKHFPNKSTKVSIACCELWIYSIHFL